MQRGESKKIALLGGTGVGKDTFVQVVLKHFAHLRIERIRLAEPLYAVQKYVYEICRKEKEEHVQDGELLNFLGSHMRKINPDVLKTPFEKRVEQIAPFCDLILCSDVRPKDLDFVKAKGFYLLRIWADPNVALARRKKRGDITLADAAHPTEIESVSAADFELINNGTEEEFEAKILKFMDGFYDFDRR